MHTCERRYYFQYLVPARINSRDKTLQEIAFLKKLKNIPMWKGGIFHSLLAEYFRKANQGTRVSLIDLLKAYLQEMKGQWKLSISNSYKFNLGNIVRKDTFTLFEHLYQEKLSENSLKDTIQDVISWTERFDTWLQNVNFHDDLSQASQIWIEPLSYGREMQGFEVDGVWVITKVDLAFLFQDRKFAIFDWKTSIPNTQPTRQITQPEFQAAVYQLWPHLKLFKPLNTISAHFVYLGNTEVKRQIFRIDENIREYTLSLIRRSVSRMQYFNNLHFDKFQKIVNHNFCLNLDDLDFAVYEKACIFCPFRRLCQRELEI